MRAPASGRHPAGWRTLRSAPNCSLLPTSAISLLFSQRRGTEQAVATCRQIPGRCLWHPRGKAGQWKEGRGSHPHPPISHRLAALPGGGSAAQPEGTEASGRLPAPPRRRPHPQSFRRPSAHPPGLEWEGAAWAAGATGVGAALRTLPGSGRLGRVPLTFDEASPGPGPAPREREEAPVGGHGGAERPAAGERPAAASSPVKSRSLPRSVRSRPSVRGPSLPRRPSPGSAARPLLPRQSARGLAGSLPAPAAAGAARSGAGGPRAAWRGPSPKGRGGGGAARAGGAERRVGGGCETAPWAPYRSPLASGWGARPPGSGGRAAGAPRLAAKGARGEGVRGSDSPRARV